MLKQSQSISTEVKKQSLLVALKVCVIVFFVSLIFLFNSQIRKQSYAITKKLDIDKGYILKSLEIGDLFFITQYVDAFVKSGIVEFVGLREKGGSEWIAMSPRKGSLNTNPSADFKFGVFDLKINESWFLPLKDSPGWEITYSYKISYLLFFWALLLAMGLSFLIFFTTKILLQSTAYYISKPVEALSKDLEQQKHKSLNEYEQGLRFYETDEFVKTLKDLFTEIAEQQERIKDIEVFKALNRISRQVNHDIQSPVGALRVAVKKLPPGLDQLRSLIEKSVQRIEAIASDLEKTNSDIINETASDLEEMDLIPLLQDLIQEKKSEYRNKDVEITISSNLKKLTWVIGLSDFHRAISNLINNGIEAVEGKRVKIEVLLGEESGSYFIEVRDNGSGVPVELESEIFNYGFTSGKEKGSGFGLHYARMIFEKSGAHLNYKRLTSGSGFRISFPFCKVNIKHGD